MLTQVPIFNDHKKKTKCNFNKRIDCRFSSNIILLLIMLKTNSMDIKDDNNKLGNLITLGRRCRNDQPFNKLSLIQGKS